MTRDPVAPAQDTQFRDFIAVLKRRKGILVLAVLLFVSLGVVSILLTPTSYRAVSRILVQASTPGAPPMQATDPVSKMVLPNVTPDIGGHMGRLQSPAVLSDSFQQAGVQLPSNDEATQEIVGVKQEGNTSVLDITVNLPSAESAARLAQQIPVSYNNSLVAEREAQAVKTRDLTKSQLDAARSDLQKAEDALAKFRATNDAVAPESEGLERQNRLHQYETELELARTTLAAAQSRYDESKRALAALKPKIDNPVVTNAVDRRASQERTVATLRTQLAQARVVHTDGSEEVKSLLAQLGNELEVLRTLPTEEERGQKQILNPELPAYRQRVAEANEALVGARSQVDKLESIVAKERGALEAYKRRIPQEQKLQNDIGLKQQQVSTLSANYSTLTNLARPTDQPVQVLSVSSAIKTSPVVTRTIVASVLLGLIFGVAAGVARDRADGRIHTLDQIYDATGAMPLGQVSTSDKALALESGRARSAVLEGYRVLRFNLESSSNTGSVQSVLVTSASAGEGRAGLSRNLAVEAATDEHRTILVDADMRTPELHGLLKLDRGPGLSDVLNGLVALDQALVQTSTPNLWFLPAGSETANPLELLSGTALEELHAQLKSQADVIVFNSPSLLRFSDGRALARVADSVLYVARRGFTKRDAMRYCVETLRRAHARLLGVVLSEDGVRVAEQPFFAAE